MTTVSLIIPVYNGEDFLTKTFSTLDKYQQQFPGFFFVFFVDDGSQDNTRDVMEKYCTNRAWARLLFSNSNQGKGQAIKMAIPDACNLAQVVGFTDVDLPYGLEKLAEVVNLIGNGVDMVIGDRSGADSSQYSFYRRLAKWVFRFFVPKGLREIRDTQSGFKFFSADVGRQLFTVVYTSRWVFDIELLLAAIRNNYQVVPLPVKLVKEPTGKGGLRIFTSGPQILKDMLRIYSYDRNRAYKIK